MVRRVLSILLCGCLLAGNLPVTGIAAEEQTVSATEEMVENTGGGHNNASTQVEEDTEPSDQTERETAVKQETNQETKAAEEETKETEAAGEDGTEEMKTATETQTASPEEEKKTDADTKVSEEVNETEQMTATETESVFEEATETQTELLTEEENTDETAVNQDEGDTVAAKFKEVQEGGYFIFTDIEISDTSKRSYLYWKEKESKEYSYANSFISSRTYILSSVKPNTTYVLELRSSQDDSAQIYDRKEITTTDYKFQTSVTVENIKTTSADIKIAVTDYNQCQLVKNPEN